MQHGLLRKSGQTRDGRPRISPNCKDNRKFGCEYSNTYSTVPPQKRPRMRNFGSGWLSFTRMGGSRYGVCVRSITLPSFRGERRSSMGRARVGALFLSPGPPNRKCRTPAAGEQSPRCFGSPGTPRSVIRTGLFPHMALRGRGEKELSKKKLARCLLGTSTLADINAGSLPGSANNHI